MGVLLYDRDSLWPIICERLAGGESLREICHTEDFPSEFAVRNWAKDEPYASQYAQAREHQAHALVDEVLAASRQEPRMVTIVTESGSQRVSVDGAEVQNRRLLCDNLKWSASKILPKVYGDKTAVEHSGTLNVAQALADELRANLAHAPKPADG